MATIRTYLSVTGLTDVGYQFYTQNTSAGARSTAGVIEEGDGWYSASGVTLVGDNLRWDSTGTPAAIAREDLTVRNLVLTFVAGTAPTLEQIAARIIADHGAGNYVGMTITTTGNGGCGSYINPAFASEWG